MKTDFSHCRNFFIFHPSPLVMCLIWVSYSLHFYKFCNPWCLNLIFVFSSSLPFFPFASFPVLFLYFFYSFLSYILIFFFLQTSLLHEVKNPSLSLLVPVCLVPLLKLFPKVFTGLRFSIPYL